MKTLNQYIEELREIFLTKEVFQLRISPLEKIVYGFTSVVLLTVAGALVALVMRK